MTARAAGLGPTGL